MAAWDAITPFTLATASPAGGTHTPAGTPTGALVWVLYDFSTAPTTGTVTYPGGTAVFEGGITEPQFGQARVECYSFKTVTSGAQAVSVPWTGGSGVNCYVFVETFTASNQSTMCDAAVTASGQTVTQDPTVALTTGAVGDMLVDGLISIIVPQDSTYAPTGSRDSRWLVNIGDAKVRRGSSIAATGSTFNMTWTQAAPPWSFNSWALIGIVVKNAAAGGGGKPALHYDRMRRE